MIDINLSKVNKSYGFDKILNNIDLTVQKGEKVALIGPNGSGKSTILKIFHFFIPIFHEIMQHPGVSSGVHIHYNNQNLHFSAM